MSLVGKVGRRRPRARLAMGIVYAILSIGAIATLYPFLLMVSTSMKGPTDQNDNKLIPAFLSDQDEVYKKYLDDKYMGDPKAIASNRIGKGGDPAAYRAFLLELPLDQWTAGFRMPTNGVTSRLTELYRQWLRTKFGTIDKLNKQYIDENLAFQTVVPPNEFYERAKWVPADTPKWRDWQEFKASLPAEFRIPVRKTRLWQLFLGSKFKNQFDQVPPELKNASSFEQLTIPSHHPLVTEFENGLPARYRNVWPEKLWADKRSGDLPIAALERDIVAHNSTRIRQEFASRNYRYVLDYIALNGRSLWNTVIFCLLAVLTQLTVNPLAAYALSRYPIRASAQILIFLLATMAFPAEVAMIPSFLLLKGLGLLNTFAALVLPTAASGYMIFLLKGFFDSLPPELYESAQIDGARETTMMWRIALPLSRPVLGYLALLAFMSAYGAFMYAFLVAQDQKMWTLMVWIFQLQQIAPKAVIMAALTLAAIPTLAIFLLAQRTIMRGIVLPNER